MSSYSSTQNLYIRSKFANMCSVAIYVCYTFVVTSKVMNDVINENTWELTFVVSCVVQNVIVIQLSIYRQPLTYDEHCSALANFIEIRKHSAQTSVLELPFSQMINWIMYVLMRHQNNKLFLNDIWIRNSPNSWSVPPINLYPMFPY